MKICLVDSFSETSPDGFVKALIDKGHVVTPHCEEGYDAIISASIARMDQTIDMMNRFKGIPVIAYCWDYYKWAHEGKHPYLNWGKYAAFLKKCSAIMVPSKGQQLRLKELLGLDSVVVETSIAVYEHESTDERFVLDPVRYYPEENQYWVEQACKELGIRCIHSEHQFPKEVFEGLVHKCTFMTCAYREASTGGLTLMEGLWNGKPSLVSNSPYMGAKDYLGDFGTYFQYDDYEDLKRKIKEMFDNPPKIDVAKAREYMTASFSAEAMAAKIETLCERLKS